MYLRNQGLKFGSEPLSCVTLALLSFLTLSMVPYLKKPGCQTNLEDEVQPKGRGLFIGIVEQQLPTAVKKTVRAEPFHFFSLLLSAPVFLSVLFFSFFLYLSRHTGKHAKYSRALQAEGLHKEQQQDIGQA